jgi:hypothetical protein
MRRRELGWQEFPESAIRVSANAGHFELMSAEHVLRQVDELFDSADLTGVLICFQGNIGLEEPGTRKALLQEAVETEDETCGGAHKHDVQ